MAGIFDRSFFPTLAGSHIVDTSAPWLLVVYGAGIAIASLVGGWLPTFFKITHTRMQMVMAFVAGLILGVSIYHLLPHSLVAISGAGAVETVVAWMMAGVVLTLVLLYLFDFHEHDFSEEHGHQHDNGGHSDTVASPFRWVGIALGLGVHSITEGLTLGSTMRLTQHGEVTALGLGVFLAIALHKPLDSLSIVSTMQANGASLRTKMAVNLGYALLCPLAAFATYWGALQLGHLEMAVLGRALAFAAGTFLCIALSDLLPEVHFHSHDRLKLAACFLIGTCIAYALHWVEPSALHGLEHGH